jgi:hypothetical protein
LSNKVHLEIRYTAMHKSRIRLPARRAARASIAEKGCAGGDESRPAQDQNGSTRERLRGPDKTDPRGANYILTG